MVLSRQQKELLENISKMFPKGKIKLSITKNGEIIFPTNKKEVRFIKRVTKGLSPMSDKSFVDEKWYECTTGKHDPSIGEVTVILDITKYMADKIGLLNRKSTEELMAGYLQSLELTPKSFAFIMIDVDNFKRINDTYGHLAGDAVLNGIADAIKKSVRSTDIVGRYGGDEMFLLLKNVPPEVVQAKAEEIRTKIQELEILFAGVKISSLTISIGVYAVSNEEFDSVNSNLGVINQEEKGLKLVETLEKTTDSALEASKNSGKNRVVMVTSFSGENIPLEPPRMLTRKPAVYYGRRTEDVQNV